jgi:glycosyltransferase involved in cell wall biosynthesis
MPFFSIIIPSYNRLHTLPATIESVMQQTCTDFEIIVADDGSADETANWISKQNDKRIKYIYQSNAGVCAARNKGASIAEGEYLIFLDSDDRVLPTWLEDFKTEIDQSNVDVVYCKRIINGETTDGKGYQGFLAGTFAMKNSLFKQIGGYDEVLKFGENTELKWRIQLVGAIIHFINKANVVYEIGENGGGTNRENRIKFYYHIENKHASYFRNHKRELQNLCQVAGVDCIVLKRKIEGFKLLWKGYLINPIHFPSFLRILKYIF